MGHVGYGLPQLLVKTEATVVILSYSAQTYQYQKHSESSQNFGLVPGQPLSEDLSTGLFHDPLHP